VVSFDAAGQRIDVYAMDDAPASVVMAILNALTDELCELFCGEPIPPCPGHAHPMRPQLSDTGMVAWQCPVDGRRVDPIWPPPAEPGSLANS
jgi:hypothetical protein